MNVPANCVSSTLPVQIVGFGVRIYCHYYTNQIPSYVIQSCFILLAPVLYAASIYMVLGRLIRSVRGERFSLIRATWITKVFVIGDLLALNVQGNGAGLASNEKHQKVGEYIVIGGLIIQLIVFGFFVVCARGFHRRMGRCVAEEGESNPDIPWRQGLNMLYACSALIAVRSIFRVVEYVMGVDSYLLANEWPMYVFDSTLMFGVQVIFFIWYPSKFVVKKDDGPEDAHSLEAIESQRGSSDTSTRLCQPGEGHVGKFTTPMTGTERS